MGLERCYFIVMDAPRTTDTTSFIPGCSIFDWFINGYEQRLVVYLTCGWQCGNSTTVGSSRISIEILIIK